MARKASRTSANRRPAKAEGREKRTPPAGRPDESATGGADRDDESGLQPAGDGTRVAVLARSIVSPRLKR